MDKLIWIDLEMTGLDPVNDKIIEIASIITDSKLNILAHGPVLAITQPQETLQKMDQWNRHHHQKSGLITRVQESTINEQQAEALTLDFLSAHLSAKQSPICGNSICQDRRFLAQHMPKLEQFFHYRNLDVSSIKELARRWYPNLQFNKKNTHQALLDIEESIAELRFYQEKIFKTAEEINN